MPKNTVSRPALPAVSREFYAALKTDIEERGIVIPLVFDSKGRCLDGLIRLRVAEELGLSASEIPRVVVGNLSQVEGDDWRVAVNGLRRQLNREQLREVLAWTLRRHGEESDSAIADRTGSTSKTVSKVRKLLDLDKADYRLGKDGKRYPAKKPLCFAHNAAAARDATKSLASLGSRLGGGYHALRKVRRELSQGQRDAAMRNAGATLPRHIRVIHGDFRMVFREVKSGSVNLVVRDPPWHDQKLRQPFADEVYRILRPGGMVACYTGHSNLPGFLDALLGAGLTYRWLVIGANSDRHGQPRGGHHGVAEDAPGAGAILHGGSFLNLARAIVILQKGGRLKTVSLLRDVLWSRDREKTYCDWQQPLSESVELVRCMSRPGDLVADLTSGSFTVAEAVCRVGGGRRFFGCEIEEGLVRIGQSRVAEALGTKKKPALV